MSDCRTEAMVPKEPTRTCKGCSERLPLDACKIKARCYDLGQRYQQLEQVARDMCNAVAPMHEYCNEDTCCALVDMGWGGDSMNCCLCDFRKRLEALGGEHR